MKTVVCVLLLLVFALGFVSTPAHAQWDASAEEATSTTTAPAPPGQMVSEMPMLEPQQPNEAKAFKPASFAWSIGVGVPIVLDVPRDVVRPGANIFFFGGADFGFFMVGGDIGLQWNPIDLNNDPTIRDRRPLTRIHLTVPDIRFQVPNLKVVLPYISFAFDMNFWNLAETGIACGYWYCSTVSVYRFTPGFTGKAGLAFEVKESGVHIDVAFQYSFTGQGNFFQRSGWWLAPVIGVLVRQ